MEEPNNYPLNEAKETKSAHYNITESSRPRERGVCFRNKMGVDIIGKHPWSQIDQYIMGRRLGILVTIENRARITFFLIYTNWEQQWRTSLYNKKEG